MKTKILIVAVGLALSVNVQAKSNQQRVVERYPEAICFGTHGYWTVKIKPACGPHEGVWTTIGSDDSSEDTAWFTALEWLLAYDYCQ